MMLAVLPYARWDKRNHHAMKKPNPVVTRLDPRRTEVSCGDQSTIVLEDWGSPPDFMVDWTVEGIPGYWPSRQAAIDAAQDLVRDRYDPMRDLVRRVCHGESTLPWAVLHDFDGDHRFPELLSNTSDDVKDCLDKLLGEQPLTMEAISRAAVRAPWKLHFLDGYVQVFVDRGGDSEVVRRVQAYKLNVRFWRGKLEEVKPDLESNGLSYDDVAHRIHKISPYIVLVKQDANGP